MRTFNKQAQDVIEQVALNNVLAKPEAPFTYGHVAAAVHVSVERATSIVRKWQRDGVVIVDAEAKGKGHKWFRVRPGFRLPVEKAGRSPLMNLWAAMRGLKTFSAVDLSAHATTETIAVSTEAARAYATALLAAGYLKVERKAVPGRQDAIYRLIRNTGPIPPVTRRVEAVVDLNTGSTIVIGGDA